jgi:hypothetical protein
LSRKIFRNSLNSRRPTDASVKEENEDEEEEEEEDDVGVEKNPTLRKQSSQESDVEPPSQPKPLLQRLTKMGTANKITIISPSVLSVTSLPEKKKPRPLIKSSTVSANIGSPKLIRPTLKALSDKSSPHSSPVSSPTTENRKSLSNIQSKPNEGTKKVFNRGSTSPALTYSQSPNLNPHLQSDSVNEIIPGPPTVPPPIESPEIITRPRLNSDDWDPLSSEKHLGMTSAALPNQTVPSPTKTEISTHMKPSQIRPDSPDNMNGDFGETFRFIL